VLLDPIAVPDRTGGEADRGRARKRAVLDALRDLCQRTLCRREQVLALAPALLCDERVAADHEALVRVVV